MIVNDYEYEYNMLVDELTSLVADFNISLQYQLMVSGGVYTTHDEALLDQLKEAGLNVTDASLQLQDEAVDVYDKIYQLKSNIPGLQNRDSYITITNLFLNTFYPEQTSIEEAEFNIEYDLNEYVDEVKTEIETVTDSVYTSIFDVKDNINSSLAQDNDFINKIVSDNIDFVEVAINKESDTFFDWFTDEVQRLADPILSEASLMYNQIKKIANEAAQEALSTSKDIYNDFNEFKDSINMQVSTSIDSVVKYIGDVAHDIEDFYNEAMDDIRSNIEDIKEVIKEAVKPFFTVRKKVINYFMLVVAQVFEAITAEIPDIKL